jgi:hypothetical protein
LATAQIALVREHTEQIRPPRALWVPFSLGRPLGVPNDTAFQRRVLISVLDLFAAESGPVLVDFPDDAPGDPAGASEEEMEGMACPVPMAPTPEEDDDDRAAALTREITRLGPWYDLTVDKRGRTTVGISGLEMEDAARYVAAILDDPMSDSPRDDLSRGEALKLACEDLRAYYLEAVTAQPGHTSIAEREDWFWNETHAGKAFWALKPICQASDDPMMQAMGNYLLVPRSQLGGVGANPEYDT